jgi:hypothetical protein
MPSARRKCYADAAPVPFRADAPKPQESNNCHSQDPEDNGGSE